MNVPVIAIMVKNEAENICKTLEPFFVAGYKDFCIYDTGSTDNTVPLITEFAKTFNVTPFIFCGEFVNYAESRNFLINLVNANFSDRKFFLMLDAESYITGADILISFCENLDFPLDRVFGVTVKIGNLNLIHTLLFRIGTTERFFGPVHEFIPSGVFAIVPPSIYFIHSRSQQSEERSCLRFSRDRVLIEEYLKKHPDDPRYVFYLAQTYRCLGMNNESLEMYKHRYSLTTGYEQERYISAINVAEIYHLIGEVEKYVFWNLKAYALRPTRCEALVSLAKNSEENRLKYLFSKLACESQRESQDTLFIRQHEYDFDRWDQLAISAYYTSDYITGFNALLKSFDNSVKSHGISNIRFYKAKLQKDIYDVMMLKYKCKIINLILYSETNAVYMLMKQIIELYMNSTDIEYYFYMFKEDIQEDYVIEGNMIYIKGKETYMGILDKTLKVMEIFKDREYDFIVRSNISSVINFDILRVALPRNADYTGFYYSGFYLDTNAGITEDFYNKYKHLGFVSDVCIILSKKCINFLLDNKNQLLEYKVSDDVAFGVLMGQNTSQFRCVNFPYSNFLKFVYEQKDTEGNSVVFRHRNDSSRYQDFALMNSSIENVKNNLFF